MQQQMGITPVLYYTLSWCLLHFLLSLPIPSVPVSMMTTSLPGHTLRGSSVVYSQGNENILNILLIICHWLSNLLKSRHFFTKFFHHCYHLTCTFGTSRGTYRQISKSGFVICSGLFALHQWRLLKRLHQHSAVNQC